MQSVTLFGWDNINKGWRKVLVNADGKLIIDPSEIFENTPTDNEHGKAPDSDWAYDHKANASAHHTKYTDAEARTAVGYNGTKYWSCVGLHFDTSDPDVDDITKDSGGGIFFNASGIRAWAAVFLPHGAVVIQVAVYGDAGSSDVTWYLTRIALPDKTANVMASAFINTPDGSISYDTVDNSLYAYYLRTVPLHLNSEIYGAKITYTI